MEKYLNKATNTIVEAVQLTADNVGEVANWTQGQIVEERDPIREKMYEGINMQTMEGRKRLSIGMYAILYNGHFAIARPSVFEKKYEKVFREKVEEPKQHMHRVGTDPFEGMTRFNEGPKP